MRAILSLGLAACALGACRLPRPGNPPPPATALSDFVQEIPGTTVSFEMIAMPPADGAGLHESDPSPRPFWIARTETTWDLFDVYLYGLDETQEAPGEDSAGNPTGPDAISRPSRPYLPPDRGYGHAGYPAISVTFHAAREFCRWLSARTGRRYRLPSAAEWEFACRAGSAAATSFGDDPSELERYAWFRDNAEDRTHPVGTREPNAWGLVDMHGNAAEWVETPGGRGVTKGGHFRDDPGALRCEAITKPSRKWNESDPQIPKSSWWLADGPFVGFRVVCEASPPPPADRSGARAAHRRGESLPRTGPE